MESLVEPTIGRWFTAPFRERRTDVVDPVRTMIRSTNPRGDAGCCHAISALDLTDQLAFFVADPGQTLTESVAG
jgi:3-oxoadipate enol-lactonase